MPLKDPDARRRYHRDYLRKRYQEDPEHRAKVRATTKASNAKTRNKAKVLIVLFKAHGCRLCPEKEMCCLSAHHLYDKAFTIGDGASRKLGYERFEAELKKCLCVCENCHRKIHAGVLKLEDYGFDPHPCKSPAGSN